MGPGEGAGFVDGALAVRRDVAHQVPDVHHVVVGRQRDVDAGLAPAVGEGADLVDEDLGAAGLDQQRRQAAQVGEQRRDVRPPRIGAGQVARRRQPAVRLADEVERVIRPEALAGAREVDPRRDRDARRRQRPAADRAARSACSGPACRQPNRQPGRCATARCPATAHARTRRGHRRERPVRRARARGGTRARTSRARIARASAPTRTPCVRNEPKQKPPPWK